MRGSLGLPRGPTASNGVLDIGARDDGDQRGERDVVDCAARGDIPDRRRVVGPLMSPGATFRTEGGSWAR
jgi:hypothetical protein